MPYLYWLCFIGMYIQNTWQCREKESHISHPLKQRCRHINPSMAEHQWRQPGDNIRCLHAVWDWAHQVCNTACWTQCRYTRLVQDAVFSSSPVSTSYMTRQHQKIWPRENQVINRVLLEFQRLGSSHSWASVLVNLFLQYGCSSKEILTVGDTLICHMILWSVLQKGLLSSVVNFPAHCHSDDRLAGKLSQTLGTLTNSNWLCNRSRQHVQC